MAHARPKPTSSNVLVKLTPKRGPGRPPLPPEERARRAAEKAADVPPKRALPKRTAATKKMLAQAEAQKRARIEAAACWRPAYIAERYGISRSLVRKLYDRGDLPHRRIGSTVLIPVGACKAFFGDEQ
jgi:hypothetical protein